MGPTLFKILIFSFVYTRRICAGYVETVVCEDPDCCEDCNTFSVDPVHFGICRKKMNKWETHFCSPAGLYYVHNIYDSENCYPPPIEQTKSGQCYQRFDEIKRKSVSYFFVCHHGILESNQRIDENNAENEINEGRLYLIGAVVMVLAFIGGTFGGYIVYKKQCCYNSKNKTECYQTY